MVSCELVCMVVCLLVLVDWLGLLNVCGFGLDCWLTWCV